ARLVRRVQQRALECGLHAGQHRPLSNTHSKTSPAHVTPEVPGAGEVYPRLPASVAKPTARVRVRPALTDAAGTGRHAGGEFGADQAARLLEAGRELLLQRPHGHPGRVRARVDGRHDLV